MRFVKSLCLTATVLSACLAPARADIDEQSGWLAWFNNTALSPRFGVISDVQLRSQDEWSGPRNLLIRPGLSWTVAPGHSITAGYAYIGTFRPDAPDATEHRSWQQYVASRAMPAATISQRLRLEQRFIGRPGGPDIYSDRLRWFGRAVIPLESSLPFTHGSFIALQNEVFVNLSGRDELNGRVFDQNRAYVAIGWRRSPSVDLEIGYLNQWINGRNGDIVNHVLQVALYTSFRRN